MLVTKSCVVALDLSIIAPFDAQMPLNSDMTF